MPYFISDEQDDCAGWATIKISDDGSIETIGCHETMNDAVAQMVAVSLDEGIEPGGEYDRNEAATRTKDIPTMKRAELANIREVRQFGISDIEVREQADTDTVTFSGYATVFNHDYEVYDAYGKFTERIAPGAFTRTLSEAPDVVLNLNHGAGGTGLPIARTKSGTLTLAEDSVGLRVSASLDKRDPDVQAILPKMRRGDLDEMSLAFRVAAGEQSQEWDETYTDRTIRQINLSRGDVSIVTFGANPATVAALRAALADDDVRAQLFAELDERMLTTDSINEPTDGEAAEAPEPDEDSEQQRFGTPVSYYLSQLVDRRMPA